MKLSSIPAAVKVGSAGVIGGGGIAGTGLLIHDQIQKSKNRQEQKTEEIDYKLKNLDNKLIEEDSASISFKDNDFNISTKNTEAVISVKASASAGNDWGSAGSEKWICTIKGIVKGEGAASLDSNNFVQSDQKTLFTSKFSNKKDGFVKSCARNRTGDHAETAESLTSEIKVSLQETTKTGSPSTKQYVFPQDFIEKVFSGNWVNPEGLE